MRVEKVITGNKYLKINHTSPAVSLFFKHLSPKEGPRNYFDKDLVKIKKIFFYF